MVPTQRDTASALISVDHEAGDRVGVKSLSSAINGGKSGSRYRHECHYYCRAKRQDRKALSYPTHIIGIVALDAIRLLAFRQAGFSYSCEAQSNLLPIPRWQVG
jgi:hypothetical protein